MYIPLHGHSTLSFLEALGHPKDIVKRAKEIGLSAIAITDYNGMFGIPVFFQAAKDSKNPDNENDQGVKAIFGSELGFVMDLNSSLTGKSVGNICILAENDKGYRNMIELVTFANQAGLSNGSSKIDLNILKEKSDGIVIFTGGEQSWISQMLNSGESDAKIGEIYGMLQGIFGEKCYLEITAQDETLLPNTKKTNQFIYNLAKQTNTKLIVNNDYHYLLPHDKESREIALAIKDGLKMYDTERRKPLGKHHIMDGKEIKEICLKNGYSESEVDEWMNNNEQLAQTLNVSLTLNQKLFPKYETPDDIKRVYDKYIDTTISD